MKNNIRWSEDFVRAGRMMLLALFVLCSGLNVYAQSEGLTKAEERMLRRLEREALRRSEIPKTPVKKKVKKKKKAESPADIEYEMMQNLHPKHKHGDWYFGLGAGFSQSMAENSLASDFITHQTPSLNFLFGHNFNPAFGFRVTGGMNMQVSRCSEAAEKAMPEIYGNGRYSFRCLNASLSGVLNLTNVFFGYEVERQMTWSFLFGAGMIKTFNFEKDKLALWNRTPNTEKPYYPVDGKGGNYIVGHIGTQIDVRLNEPFDINIDLRLNATDNKYNGVTNGNNIDFYLDLMVNFVYHFKNGKQNLRRFRQPPHVAFVDPVLIDRTHEYQETVRYGEAMQTQIPFYAGFYYLNAATTKRLGYVAKFLQRHPLVNLNIVGHPDIIPDDDVEYHTHLAQKRAETVREALITKFQIEPSRLRISLSDRALQSYKTVREWVPSVSFIMEDSGDKVPAQDMK